MEWISCKYQLPKYGELVEYREGFGSSIAKIKRNIFGDYWEYRSGLRGYSVSTLDMWRPLPKPPID